MEREQEKETQQLRKRFRELADKSFRQGIFTFTGFLGLNEQECFWRMEEELRYAGCEFAGGYENADRRILRFGNPTELGYETDFPMACIHIQPLMYKFADELSHRDFLGALMNLGIERSTLGDIRVGDREAYLFCLESMGDFICENLRQIKHTRVTCHRTADYREIPQKEPEKELLQVSSSRVDGVTAKVYHLSRGECLELFRAGRMFVNGRLCENNSRLLKAGETVNARGYGKYIYQGELGETRKGKLHVEIAVFR
ncbi:MAG: YlmH/Sll1252 family protein [Roseburia sp.]|nr:YlmH/Sll1252 family protein [Roseburia sp.]